MGKTIKVLAVDDEAFMLKILKTCMHKPDFEISSCSDAMSAMSVFKSGYFDIILLDIVMPIIDGFELHSLIRNVRPDIPIIMLTAKVDDMNGTMLQRISKDRNTYYQSKSFNKDELIAKVKSIVAERKNEIERKRYFEEMEKDAELAGEVQRTMFPSWDSIYRGARLSLYYRPYMKITGDIVNVMHLHDDKFLMLVGDISGHGIQSALCMSAISYSIATMTRHIGVENITPEKMLNHLQSFMNNIGSDRYMTCLAAVLDFGRGVISFQNAGHPDFIMFSPSAGGIINPNPGKKGSLPVGIMPDTKYYADDNVTLNFPRDAIFFAYTDGLTDLQNGIGKTYNINPIKEFTESFAKDGLKASTTFQIIDALFKLGFDDIRDDIVLTAISAYTPEKDAYDYTIKPMVSEVDKFAQEFCRLVIERTGDEPLAAKVELLLSEFLNNVVVHGLGNKNAPRPVISARIEFREKEIMLAFYDKGKDWNMQTSGIEHDSANDILNYTRATSGRGLSIIKKITSSISRRRYANMLNETILTVSYK